MPDPINPALLQSIFTQTSKTPVAAPGTEPNPTFNPPPVPAFVAGQYMSADPSALATMASVNPEEDMTKIMKYMPQTPAGPYGSAAGEDVTSKMYQQQMSSPYVTGIAQKLGVNHPRLASVVDNAMLGISGAEEAHERAIAAGHGAGFGAGLASLVAGATAPGQAQLARREQLEETRLGYQTQEAQLQNLRTEGLKNTLGALSEYENNPAKILSMYGRGQVAAYIASQARERVAQGQNLTKYQIALLNDQEKFQQAQNSDASKQYIAQFHERAVNARNNSVQLHKVYGDFVQNINKSITDMREKEHAEEGKTSMGPGGIPQAKSPEEIQALREQLDSDIRMELGYAEHASQEAFGRGFTSLMGDYIAGPQHTTGPGTTPQASAPEAKPAPTATQPNSGQWNDKNDPQGLFHKVGS